MCYSVETERDFDHYKAFVAGLLALYPCETCKKRVSDDRNIQIHLASLQDIVWPGAAEAGRLELTGWAVLFHGLVSSIKDGPSSAETAVMTHLVDNVIKDEIEGGVERGFDEVCREADAKWAPENRR
jgi:hypothetical protein